MTGKIVYPLPVEPPLGEPPPPQFRDDHTGRQLIRTIQSHGGSAGLVNQWPELRRYPFLLDAQIRAHRFRLRVANTEVIAPAPGEFFSSYANRGSAWDNAVSATASQFAARCSDPAWYAVDTIGNWTWTYPAGNPRVGYLTSAGIGGAVFGGHSGIAGILAGGGTGTATSQMDAGCFALIMLLRPGTSLRGAYGVRQIRLTIESRVWSAVALAGWGVGHAGQPTYISRTGDAVNFTPSTNGGAVREFAGRIPINVTWGFAPPTFNSVVDSRSVLQKMLGGGDRIAATIDVAPAGDVTPNQVVIVIDDPVKYHSIDSTDRWWFVGIRPSISLCTSGTGVIPMHAASDDLASIPWIAESWTLRLHAIGAPWCSAEIAKAEFLDDAGDVLFQWN